MTADGGIEHILGVIVALVGEDRTLGIHLEAGCGHIRMSHELVVEIVIVLSNKHRIKSGRHERKHDGWHHDFRTVHCSPDGREIATYIVGFRSFAGNGGAFAEYRKSPHLLFGNMAASINHGSSDDGI